VVLFVKRTSTDKHGEQMPARSSTARVATTGEM
jgi:hypothetical protein